MLIVASQTLRDQARGLIGWGLGVALTVFALSGMWPSFSEVDFDELMSQYPQALMEIFNISDLSTATGYLNAEIFSLMLPLIFVVYAIGRGARLIASEEENGTLEILATMPVPRQQLVVGKAGALVSAVAALGVILFVSTWLSSAVFSLDVAVLHIFNGSLSMFLLGTEFGLISLAISAATGRRSVAIGVTSGIAGASYLLYIAGQLVAGVEPFLELSPFYQAISGGPLGPDLPALVWAMPAVGLAVFAASVPLFTTRDLAV